MPSWFNTKFKVCLSFGNSQLQREQVHVHVCILFISHITYNILVGHACSFWNYQHNPILLCFCFSCRENLKILLKDVNEQKKCIKENGIIVDRTHHGVQFVGKVINCLICYSTCINDYMHGTIKKLTLKSIRHRISYGTLGETMQLPYIWPISLNSHKRPPPISDHQCLTFWLVAYGRLDCICQTHPCNFWNLNNACQVISAFVSSSVLLYSSYFGLQDLAVTSSQEGWPWICSWGTRSSRWILFHL